MLEKIFIKKNNLFSLIFMVMFFGIPTVSFNQNSKYIEANDAFESKKYDEAIKKYNELINESNISPEIYYNLGNSYFKIEDFGHAMLYFEKALKLKPYDKDIKHNIYVTKRKIDSEIIELPDFFLEKWWISFIDLFSLKLWTYFSFLFAILMVLSLWLLWFKKERYKLSSIYLSLTLGLIFIISLIASTQVKRSIFNSQNAILIKSDTIYTAPDKRSEFLYHLDPGEKLTIKDSLNSWYKVRLLNKESGWINKSLCKKI